MKIYGTLDEHVTRRRRSVRYRTIKLVKRKVKFRDEPKKFVSTGKIATAETL